MKAPWIHSFDMNFEIRSNEESGEDLTGAEIRKIMLKRLRQIDDEDLPNEINIFHSMNEDDEE